MTVCPDFAVSPVAVSGGYGVQLQLVPRGTESPSATTDHDRRCVEPPAALVEEAVELFEEEPEHPVVTQASATMTATAHATRVSISQTYIATPACPAGPIAVLPS